MRRQIPAAHAGDAIGLYLIAWGIFTAYMFIASLRTTAAIALVFFLLTVTFFLLGIGNSGGTEGLIKAGGWFGSGDGRRGLVCIVCGGDKLDLRAHGPAGQAAGPLRSCERERRMAAKQRIGES